MELQVEPRVALVDEPVRIRVVGGPPDGEATLRLETRDAQRTAWSSCATYTADAQGSIDLSVQPPPSESGPGANGMSLFWSLAPDAPASEWSTFARATAQPLTLTLTAQAEGRPLAGVAVERRFAAPRVTRSDVRASGLVGTLFTPAVSERRPAVIVLGGSGGGVRETWAALLASRGYVALALAYFGAEGLPPRLERVPLEYFAGAIAWLQAQECVAPVRLAALGFSRGAELALVLGATFPQLRAVIASAPSNVVWGATGRDAPAWTWRGQALPFMPNRVTPEQDAAIEAQRPLATRQWYALNLEDEAAQARCAIPVERIAGPVLLLSGEDDQLWPATLMAERVERRLDAHAFPHPHTHLRFAGAGHLIDLPSLPTTVKSRPHSALGTHIAYGGSPGGSARAAVAGWRATLEALARL